MSGSPAIRLTGLTKAFGSMTAVDGVNLDIAPGEFFSMLGPSGSGKTTVLRMIAGFEQPTSGTVELFGKDVTTDPPFDRDVNTVFQDYALFPHMSVLDNVAYGLRVRGVGAKERAATALDALALVRLEGYGDRTPAQLSGGQRQRVALARALVVEPKVLLLDEPLGALDLKLREQMQVELKDIQRRLGITFIFVTHDQEEALTLSDRIAVFNEGNIVQLGSAEEIYRHPATPFVANFVGSSTVFTSDESKAILGTSGACSLRPEHIDIVRGKSPTGTISLTGTVFDTIFLGASTRVIVDLDAGKRVAVLEQNDMSKKETHRGDSVTLAIHPQFLSKLA